MLEASADVDGATLEAPALLDPDACEGASSSSDQEVYISSSARRSFTLLPVGPGSEGLEPELVSASPTTASAAAAAAVLPSELCSALAAHSRRLGLPTRASSCTKTTPPLALMLLMLPPRALPLLPSLLPWRLGASRHVRLLMLLEAVAPAFAADAVVVAEGERPGAQRAVQGCAGCRSLVCWVHEDGSSSTACAAWRRALSISGQCSGECSSELLEAA